MISIGNVDFFIGLEAVSCPCSSPLPRLHIIMGPGAPPRLRSAFSWQNEIREWNQHIANFFKKMHFFRSLYRSFRFLMDVMLRTGVFPFHELWLCTVCPTPFWRPPMNGDVTVFGYLLYMAVELVGENPHHTVWQPFESDSSEKSYNPCWKKQGEDVTSNNDPIETEIFELDIFWELIQEWVVHGCSSGKWMFAKQSIPDHPWNFKLKKGVLCRGLRDSRMARWGQGFINLNIRDLPRPKIMPSCH